MEQVIRPLNINDYPHMEAMETGIEDDYVKRIFTRLVDEDQHRLYGLFWEGQLVSVCGYTIFAESYAMIGRIRSDVRYRGKDLATQLTGYVLNETYKQKQIKWTGANTQEKNLPARRVLEKLGLREYTMIYGATTKDVSMLEKGEPLWHEINDLASKKEWIDRLYIKTEAVFPYECYYPFPASENLFSEENLAEWSFYENETASRIVITKRDFKKHDFLQAIYPWDDIMAQKGLWETISMAYQSLAAETEGDCLIWMDLTKTAANSLPDNHRFALPSPWILYGVPMKKESLL